MKNHGGYFDLELENPLKYDDETKTKLAIAKYLTKSAASYDYIYKGAMKLRECPFLDIEFETVLFDYSGPFNEQKWKDFMERFKHMFKGFDKASVFLIFMQWMTLKFRSEMTD